MHRLIVLSSTYQQSGALDSQPSEHDQLWASFTRRRLSAEELRDAMLAVSGRLDRMPGTSESGEFLFSRAEDINAIIRPNRVAADEPFYTEFTKRSIYLPVVRNMLPDVLALFDAADPNSVTAVRNESTVASQSLFLLNSPFVRQQAHGFAERLLATPNCSAQQRIELAHRLALGRQPTVDELAEGCEFITAYRQSPAAQSKSDDQRRMAAWQSYCQTLLCANEFTYIE